MTVTDLITNFRTALLGLVPSVERVGMPWRRPDAYDDWDDMVTAIYKGLVIEPIRRGLPEIDPEAFQLADYDMLLPSYAGVSVIELLPTDRRGAIRVFHALGTARAPFDIVEWRIVGVDGKPQSEELETSPFDSTRFALRMYTDGFSPYRIEEVAVSSRHCA
jgi:hypothetical protein